MVFLLFLTPAFSVLSCEVQTVCNAPNITVYRMSSLSNAHAELYTQTNYPYKVCCQDVIGGIPTGIDINNGCADINFLDISDPTNAHVERSDQGNYLFDVCLSSDDAIITYSYEAGSCSGYQACLGTYSTDTNAHVADCVTSPYPNYICANISYGYTCNDGVFSLDGNCSLACGADAQCDGRPPGFRTDRCDAVGQTYFIDVCNSTCQFIDDSVCNSTGTGGCTGGSSVCDGYSVGDCLPDGMSFCNSSCVNQTSVGDCIPTHVIRKALVHYTTDPYNRKLDVNAIKCLINAYLDTCSDSKLQEYIDIAKALPDSILPN